MSSRPSNWKKLRSSLLPRKTPQFQFGPLRRTVRFPHFTINLKRFTDAQKPLQIVMKAPFVTPIERHFPGPIPGAVLLLNRARDLSLYRFNAVNSEFKHVWSLGRFKTLETVEWSPDGTTEKREIMPFNAARLGKFIAVLCAKNCFIYEVEEGKRIGTIEAFECSLIRWAVFEGVDANLLALLDCRDSFTLRWCVDGEFALPEVKLDLISTCGAVESFQLDASAIVTMQQDGTLNSFAAPFVAGQIGSLAALSRALQSLTRVFEGVFEGIGKLLRFSNELAEKLQANAELLKNLMLFGGDGEGSLLAENEFLEFKQRLKKLHAELLVSIGDAQSASTRFKANFSDFGGQEAAKLAEDLLPRLEQVSRSAQHDLAELLLWLEPLVLEEVKKPAKALQPQELAIRSIKTMLQGHAVIDLEQFKAEFEANKLTLDGKFASILGNQKQPQLKLCSQSTFRHEAGSRLVSADGTVCLPDGLTHLRNGIPIEVSSVAESYISIHETFIEIKL